MHMKNKGIILALLSIVVTLCVGGAVGFFTPKLLSNSIQQTVKPYELSVYFIRDGSLYVTSSSHDKEEKVLDQQLLPEPMYMYSSGNPYVIAGSNRNQLFYLVQKVLNKEQNLVRFTELHQFDLDSKKDSILEQPVGKNYIQNLLVSPNGKRIAYLLSHESETDSDNRLGKLVIYDVETSSKKTIDEKKPLSWIPQAYAGGGPGILFIERWMNDKTLLMGSGYEGAQYCAFHVDTDTELSTNCEVLGSSYFETVLPNFIQDENYIGTSIFFAPGEVGPEISSQPRGIYKQKIDGKIKQFLVQDNGVNGVVLGKNQIYYTSRHNPDAFNSMTNIDIYSVDLNGTSINRKTFDGNSIQIKKNLQISPDGRFLSYEAYLTTEVSDQRPETIWNGTSVWVYDTVLNKQYKVADRAVSPFVIMQ